MFWDNRDRYAVLCAGQLQGDRMANTDDDAADTADGEWSTTDLPAAEQLAMALRGAKERSGLSFVQLAKRIPYGKSTLERYINGHQLPPGPAVAAIADACGQDPGPWLRLRDAAAAQPSVPTSAPGGSAFGRVIALTGRLVRSIFGPEKRKFANYRNVIALAILTLVVTGLIQVITYTSNTRSKVSEPCYTWADNAGPGHARRFHVKCPGSGLHVRTYIDCSDGSHHIGAYRYEYQKAECPSGVEEGYGGYDTKKIE